MSTASPSPPSSQSIASSSSTTLTMLPPSLTQPLSKHQCKQGEWCLCSFCRHVHALHCSRNLCLRHCCEAGRCPFYRLNDGPPIHGDEKDDLLIEEPEDGSFGCEDLCQTLHTSLLDLGLPIQDAPLPSMHNLLSTPPAPIPCDCVQPLSMFLEGDSSPPPMLPAMLVPKLMAKHL
jgi:hypothetical protein